ncbi:MAG: hypothetical protein KKD65_12470 [Gammaproteobacteria bacterium]|nr:hypothetical protein [Gammaproteobacteria bacterium]
MGTLNKVQVASEMFVEAHSRYVKATRDIDYITSILLSGAVIGIIGPLLKEQGNRTTHELLAKIANAIAEPGDDPAREGIFRAVYNALKHAGNDRPKVPASDDLEIQTHLPMEAARMLDAAKDDFREIEVSGEVRRSLPPEFIQLLATDDTYA